jgi:putative phosphonate catabolism associated alcohol dehydrogenase
MTSVRCARWDGVGRGFTTVAAPLPDEVRDGEVLVRVDLATICGSDRHTVAGRRPSPTPVLLGHEQVGTVVGLGPNPPVCVDGSRLEVGARVIWSVAAACGRCPRCARVLPQKCHSLRKYGHEPWAPGDPLRGGFATHCLLWPGTAIAGIPDDVPDEVAAPGSCATATVAAALRVARVDLAGARVLVAGAGMLGLTATAMAAAAGAEVTVSARPTARREHASDLGAVEVRGPDEDGDPEFDLAIETSGAPSGVATCLKSLTVAGTAVLTGSVTPGPEVPLDPQVLVRGLHTVTGVHNYEPADLRTAADFLAAAHGSVPLAELAAPCVGLDGLDAVFGAHQPDGTTRRAVDPHRSGLVPSSTS